MCGGLHTAAGNLRFDSFLTAENVVLMLIYEARALSLTLFVTVSHGSLPQAKMQWSPLQQPGHSHGAGHVIAHAPETSCCGCWQVVLAVHCPSIACVPARDGAHHRACMAP